MTNRYLVTSAPGLEDILVEELRTLGVTGRREPSGAVVVEGEWVAAARILTRSRVASRVALSLRRFSARTKAMLYDQVRRVNWPAVFSPELTVAVTAQGSIPPTDFVLSYAPLRIKDALCDEFRKYGLPRPDVDRRDPDVRVHAHFHRGRCELSVDLCGAPLHRRGYRAEGAEAPLRENRAAALLLFCGYDGSRPLVDPFCGSGTLPIEGALIATRTAPGLLRDLDRFALVRLFPATREVLETERAAAAGERRDEAPASIRGSDLSPESLAVARSNAVLAGVNDRVQFEEADALHLEAPDSFVVSNLPYGERLETRETAARLVGAFVHRVKHHAVGSTLGLVLPRGDLEHAVGLRPERRQAVESGPLELRFLRYAIYSGTRKGSHD